jgi:hypothetical protein
MAARTVTPMVARRVHVHVGTARRIAASAVHAGAIVSAADELAARAVLHRDAETT